MLKLLQILNPAFIQKLDRYLLLRYPRLWGTKLHYMVFYGLLFNLILYFLAYTYFQPYQLTSLSTILPILFFIQLAFSGYIFYLQTLFNIEQEHGNTSNWVGLFEILTHIILVLIVFSPSLTIPLAGINKTSHKVDLKGLSNNQCLSSTIMEFIPPSSFEYKNDDIAKFDISYKNRLEQIIGWAYTASSLNKNILIDGSIVHGEGVYLYKDADRLSTIFLNEVNQEINLQNYWQNYSIYKSDISFKVMLGEANIVSKNESMTIQRGNTFLQVKPETMVTINIGDILTVDGYQKYIGILDPNLPTPSNETFIFPKIIRVDGEIQIQPYQIVNITENDILITEENNSIKPLTAQDRNKVEVLGPVVGYSSLLSKLPSSAFSTCQDARFFANYREMKSKLLSADFEFSAENPERKNFIILLISKSGFFNIESGFSVWLLISPVILVLLATSLKNSNWRTLIYSILNLCAGAIVSLLIAFIYYTFLGSEKGIYIDILFFEEIDITIALGGVGSLLYFFIPFFYFFKSKRYSQYILVSFASIPIAIGLLLAILISNSTNFGGDSEYYTAKMSLIFLCLYIVYSPLQKKIFRYLTSLPRG